MERTGWPKVMEVDGISLLQVAHLYLHSNFQIIWGGDHNLTVNSRLDRYPPRLTNDVGSKDFKDILNCFDLKDSCRVLFPSSPFSLLENQHPKVE